MNLQTEIEKIKRKAVARFKNDHNDGDLAIYDVIKEMTELFDKSVERVIKSADDVGKEIDKGIFHDRKKIERKQRQTWNKIKGEQERTE